MHFYSVILYLAYSALITAFTCTCTVKGFIQHLPSIRGDIHGVRIHVLLYYCFVDRFV